MPDRLPAPATSAVAGHAARSSIIRPAVALALPTTPGNARARMGAGADEIEVADDVVAIVGAEPGALGQQRLEAEGGAEMGAEIAREIRRAEVEDRISSRSREAGQDALLDDREDALGIGAAPSASQSSGSLPRCGTGASA